ncbi:hypothetical protein UFOVP92_17 [uncultured Caudovirales phage]|uniref:Uncharacterized protein n=1 Tax=uncultured Caudovirales phage TaxID=2100421 RepID=A0A6J5L2T3_9CAUD|nr:hypothetical protein UFOVP92_17 [uncultured Caudovirales phage]
MKKSEIYSIMGLICIAPHLSQFWAMGLWGACTVMAFWKAAQE